MKEIGTSRFGRTLKGYRKAQHLTQPALLGMLNKYLKENDLGIEILHKSTVCKWEKGGSEPKRQVVVALDHILCTDGILLNAAGYVAEGVGGPSKGKRDSAVHGGPVSRLGQHTSDHFEDLARIAGELLADELDTVTPKLPDLPLDDPEEMLVCTYHAKYRIGKDRKQHDILGRRITQMLMRNFSSAYDRIGEFQVNCFMCHFRAELPGSLVDGLSNPKLGRPVFEYLALTQPFWLIYVLKRLRDGKEFEGVCNGCKKLK